MMRILLDQRWYSPHHRLCDRLVPTVCPPILPCISEMDRLVGDDSPVNGPATRVVNEREHLKKKMGIWELVDKLKVRYDLRLSGRCHSNSNVRRKRRRVWDVRRCLAYAVTPTSLDRVLS